MNRPDLHALTCTATRDAVFGNRLKAALQITEYMESLESALEQAEARIAELERDAQRYKLLKKLAYLHEHDRGRSSPTLGWEIYLEATSLTQTFDAAIDAQLSTDKGEG